MRYGILFLGLLFSAASQADGVAHYQDQRFGYVAGNLMNITLDYDSRELTPTGVGVRLGGMIDPHWGVELRAAVAPSGDTWRAENSRNKVDYTVDHCWNDVTRNDDTSLAFGAGVGVRTSFNLGLTLQYMQYVDKDYITVTGIEGGLEWYF